MYIYCDTSSFDFPLGKFSSGSVYPIKYREHFFYKEKLTMADRGKRFKESL